MPLPSLMILDGESPAALGIVRSLGRLGIPIMVGSTWWLIGRACFSRYTKKSFIYPPPESGIKATHEFIIKKIQTWRPEVLMPLDDRRGWSVVYDYWEDYERITKIVPSPNRDLFENLNEKGCQVEYAERYGIEIPKTYRPKTLIEAIALSHELLYPVLFKPQKSVSGVGIRKVNNIDEFSKAISDFKEIPLIQEQINGEDLELTLLFSHGSLLAGSAYSCLRKYPIPYGPPVACLTIHNDTLMQIGIEFLSKLRYHGVAHLDFKKDEKDGKIKLLELNPRIAETNEISNRSGINFALMLYQLAIGENIEPCFRYELDLELGWLGELGHFTQTKNKLFFVKKLLNWHKVTTEISLSDPIPEIIWLIDFIRKLLYLEM